MKSGSISHDHEVSEERFQDEVTLLQELSRTTFGDLEPKNLEKIAILRRGYQKVIQSS